MNKEEIGVTQKTKNLSAQDIENLAKEVLAFLIENELWYDVSIYFNEKRIYPDKTNETGYLVEKDVDPDSMLDYCAHPHILSMIFEGPLYHFLNYTGETSKIKEFRDIFYKYNVHYELGHAWTLSCYPN